MVIIKFFFPGLYFFLKKKWEKEILHHEDFSLPPGFSPTYARHRREHNLSEGQVCENPECSHCRTYQDFMSH